MGQAAWRGVGGVGGRESMFFLLNTPIPKCYWYLNLTVRGVGGGGGWIGLNLVS